MLLSLDQTKQKIEEGKTLYLAGDEKLLASLPIGNWIGGTIPYFMDENGGIMTKDKIFVTEQDESVINTEIKWYNENNLEDFVNDSPETGFSIVIIPASSKSHLKYAEEAPDYKNLFFKNIIGWISGVHLDDLGKITPKVFNGLTGEFSDSKLIVLHAKLPENKIPTIGTINIFTKGSGDTITFDLSGFSVNDCFINGIKQNFASYLLEKEIDIKLPLVANYSGTMINVSFQEIDKENQRVKLYAPVFTNTEYKIADPINNYFDIFNSKIPADMKNPAFSCNCILNYLYSGLEGKKTANIIGPITFGEIAYQLLNQTLVYLKIQDA